MGGIAITAWSIAGALALGLMATGAQACQFGYCFGALGVGPDGITGYSSGQPTAPDAEARLRASCGDKCTTIEIFHDACAAIVANRDGETFFGAALTRDLAKEAALATCEERGGDCLVRVWGCSL